MRSSVVLPQPEGPSSAKNSPSKDIEREMGDSGGPGEGLAHVRKLQQWTRGRLASSRQCRSGAAIVGRSCLHRATLFSVAVQKSAFILAACPRCDFRTKPRSPNRLLG